MDRKSSGITLVLGHAGLSALTIKETARSFPALEPP
jgi:hypothetical protein